MLYPLLYSDVQKLVGHGISGLLVKYQMAAFS